ncbi:MAG: hypothetical protein ABJN69_11110 [Hellea sp.]
MSSLFGTSTFAQDDPKVSVAPRFSGDIRLRYQSLIRDDFVEDAEVLTMRFRGGLEVDLFEKTSVLIEIEGAQAIVDDYNDGTGNRPFFPVVPDPEGVALNRLQVISEIIPKTRITAGRQKLALDDWRFIGAFPFRQNDQTIDALRFETTAIGPGILDIGYFNKVHRPLGPDNVGGVFKGDSFFLNYNLATVIGRVSAFHYATELETGPSGPLRHIRSSQTTGIRVIGRHDSDPISFVWQGSYARQSDYSDNPNNYSTDYGLAELSLKPAEFTLKVRAEKLGSDNGISLQTPLASLHSFQGFADQFLQTPPDGVRDYSVLLQYNFGSLGPLTDIKSFVRHHWFQADTDGRDYGREVNLSLKARINKVGLALEYADYQASTFSSDNKALFLTTEFSF